MPSSKKTKKATIKSGNLFDFIEQSNQESSKKSENKENNQKAEPLEGIKTENKDKKLKENIKVNVQEKPPKQELAEKEKITPSIQENLTQNKTETEKVSITNLIGISAQPKKTSKKKTTEEKKESQINESIEMKASPEKQIISKELTKSDLKFYKKDNIPFGEQVFKNVPKIEEHLAAKSQYLLCLIENDMICTNMEQGLLLTVEYCGYQNKAYCKFYDLKDDKIKFWIDTTGHRPYCYHKDTKANLLKINELVNFPGFKGIDTVSVKDLMEDKTIEVSKIYGTTPIDVAGGREVNIKSILKEHYEGTNFDGAWEANIRYHHNFIYDLKLIPGLLYSIKNGKIEEIKLDVQPEIEKEFIELYKSEKQEFQNIAKKYLNIFSYPIPNIRRVAFDIEVDVPKDGHLPNTKLANEKVISVSFVGSDGLMKVYTLWNDKVKIGKYSEDFPTNADVIFFDNEKDLILETFRIIWEYPVVVSFNGDNFDFNYLYHRAQKLKIPSQLNPIQLTTGGQGMVTTHADLKYGVHLELYQVFSNRSIKGYAFGGAYGKNSLDDISKAFLDASKIKHTTSGKEGEKFSASDIANLDLCTLVYYNLNDSILTLDLTRFGDNTLWNLIVYLMRITKLPLQDLIRHQISFWIRNLMFFEHRVRNYIIPRESEIKQKKSGGFGKSVIEGKGFQGAYVITPIPGIHFNVVVTDFSSLYPSIIKSRNLSYETINCGHPECSNNFLPGTPYYACTKNIGIFALIVGFLRDIRVKWFKPRSSNKSLPSKERAFAKILQSALKVFINGSYGVFGSDAFPLFCLPVAEATTAIGRYAIKETIDKAESMGVRVLYGDTDSTFLDKPTKEQVQELIKWSNDHLKIDLEEDKTYQFLALSDRKKNYVGIYKDSLYVDIKGMTGKKSNTPPFIINAFNETTEMLTKIKNIEDFNAQKPNIEKLVRQAIKKIGKPVEQGGFPLEEYAISVTIRKKTYKKSEPQHIKAAKMLKEIDEDEDFEAGDTIDYVKTKDAEGAKPLSLATINDIDISKYKEQLKATFEQLLDALGMSFEEIEGARKLDSFFQAK